MSDPFDSSRRRLDRAKEHINDLYVRSEAFFDANPPAVVGEMNAERTREEYYIRFGNPLPGKFSDIAADAVENLRASLDHIGYAVAEFCGKTNAKFAYFPIASDATNLEMVINGRCKDLPNEITAVFRSFNPYKGGNNRIWALNRLCTVNKHRLLLPAAMWSGMHIFKGGLMNGGIYDQLIWDRAKNQIPFFWLAPGGYFHYQSKFTYAISFDEAEVGTVPAIPILNEIVADIEKIIAATESECKRIGLVT